MKKQTKTILITGGIALLVLYFMGFCLMLSSDVTTTEETTTEEITTTEAPKKKDKKKEKKSKSTTEEKSNYLGVLGTDFNSGEFSNFSEGQTFDANMNYWDVNDYDEYIFTYYEFTTTGRVAHAFMVTDETKNEDLSVLDKYTYEDDVSVKMTLEYDETIEYKEPQAIQYYVKATSFEILDYDSEPARKARGNYYAGQVMALDNGLNMTLKEMGTTYGANEDYIYVEVDVENVGKEDATVPNASYYGDGYRMDNVNPGDVTLIANTTISPGRKATGYYIAKGTWDDYNLIELELSEYMIAIVKDESIKLESESAKESAYVTDTSSYAVAELAENALSYPKVAESEIDINNFAGYYQGDFYNYSIEAYPSPADEYVPGSITMTNSDDGTEIRTCELLHIGKNIYQVITEEEPIFFGVFEDEDGAICLDVWGYEKETEYAFMIEKY